MIASLFGRPSIRGWELRQGIESLVAQVCKSRGVTPPLVTWDPSIQTAAVDPAGCIMVLACPADDAVITRPVFTRYVGYVLHEVLHLIYTSSVSKPLQGYLHSLWNAIEDAWIEGRGIADRVAGNIDAVLRELLDQMTREACAQVQDWADPRQYPFALAVYLRPHATRKVPLAQGLEPIFSEAARRLSGSQSSDDNRVIAEWVLAQLQALPKSAPQKPQEGQQGGDQGEGRGKPQPGQSGPQNGQPGEGQPADGQPGEVQHGQPGEGEPGEGEGEGQGEAGAARAPDVMAPAMEVEPNLGTAGEVAPGSGSTYCPGRRVLRQGAHLHPSWGEEYHAQVRPVSGRLRNELRRLFDNSGLSAFQRGRKSGALNVASLHKVGQSDRLFQRRLEVDGIDSAVIVLVDCSGSMADRAGRFGRRSAAVSAALAIHEALTLAGCSVCVMTFDDEVSVAVPWGCPSVKAKALLRTVGASGGTNDISAMRYAHEVLLRRTEQRRALMVLTDAGGVQDEVREQIAAGERLSISTIGIGIQANIGKVYSQSVDVFDMEELGRAALSQMKVAA